MVKAADLYHIFNIGDVVPVRIVFRLRFVLQECTFVGLLVLHSHPCQTFLLNPILPVFILPFRLKDALVHELFEVVTGF